MISIADSRPNYIDYAKVFAIFCVVLGHYTYALDFFYEPSQIWNVMHIITLFQVIEALSDNECSSKCYHDYGNVTYGWCKLKVHSKSSYRDFHSK